MCWNYVCIVKISKSKHKTLKKDTGYLDYSVYVVLVNVEHKKIERKFVLVSYRNFDIRNKIKSSKYVKKAYHLHILTYLIVLFNNLEYTIQCELYKLYH
ncbi:UNVERIFIED_CONTAM: hypothetical protein NCL1_37991 [Trichonephila clavipes]